MNPHIISYTYMLTMYSISMSHVRITEETRDKLNVLKGVLGLKSIDAVIDSLMESRMYNQAFFDKLKGLI